jgi:murein DD-endopeptidase MepM/ murein hydrolase activator NlpD
MPRSMEFPRRSVLAAAAALIAAPRLAFGAASRISLTGTLKQGGLVLGRCEPGTSVTFEGKPIRVSADGGFGFGFPYNQKAASSLVARFADGSEERRQITPQLRDYDIQRLTGLPEAYVSPPPDILERIQRESARFRQTRERDTDASWYADGFDWPAMGIISSVYGSQRILNGEARAPHLAVDIAAPTGTPIHAPADGIVSLIDDQYLNGLFTILDHGHGVSTNYVHQSRQLVKMGDRVSRGQVIGEIGQTGRATGPNLHWGMTWFQIALDPSLSTPTPKPDKA